MNTPYAAERRTTSTMPQATEADIDLVAACRTDATILFTGSPEDAEGIAREIHQSSGWSQGPFVVVDCATDDADLGALLTWLVPDDVPAAERGTPGAVPSQAGVVFLRRVDELSSSAQQLVAEWLGRVRPSGKVGPRRRVMASSREPLLPRVLNGTFDDRLYYRLTVIHIALDTMQES